jgi:sialic acid synthase SpsE
LSDHSGTIVPGLLAAWMGAVAVEVHLTLSRSAFGPDVPASLMPEDLRKLVEGVRSVEEARRSPVDKNALAAKFLENRQRFSKSLALARALPAGTVLRREDLAAKKPGTGIPTSKLESLVGATLAVDVSADVLLRPEHLKDVKFSE